MKRITIAGLALLAGACTTATTTPPADGGTAMSGHIMTLPSGVSWSPAPNALPPGAQIAVLDGDPSQAQLYTLRLRFPANYMVAPHSHPAWEHVTVITGDLHFGMGGTVNMGSAPRIGPGAFMAIRPNDPHYVHTLRETVLQLHGMGPFAINYVNPADDPRGR